MKRIGIISDTHNCFDDVIIKSLSSCDEIWHIGDFGSFENFKNFEDFKPLKAVYGNIDNSKIRSVCPQILCFNCEGVDVMMKHISGYPGKYEKIVEDYIRITKPKLVIAGHSHILKVIRDSVNDHLHINPGAAGTNGFHKVRTLVRLSFDKGEMKDLEVVELGEKNSIYTNTLQSGIVRKK